uniref:Uncharacterized protein n=1 Tax=Caenorhabditis tropicalis TaxID=1561998 RepID=A0A1I7TIR3_9PELO
MGGKNEKKQEKEEDVVVVVVVVAEAEAEAVVTKRSTPPEFPMRRRLFGTLIEHLMLRKTEKERKPGETLDF